MSSSKTLTLVIMDPPYESSNTLTAFRMIESALNKGHDVNVFAFEGAVSLSVADQRGHPNPVHGTDAAAEKHPLTRDFIAGLFAIAKDQGAKLDWVNCGFCVDERGVGGSIDGPRRGGPPDFAAMHRASDKTLIIATK